MDCIPMHTTTQSTYFVCANRMWSTDLNCFHLLVKFMPSPSSSLLGCISMNVRSCKYSPLHQRDIQHSLKAHSTPSHTHTYTHIPPPHTHPHTHPHSHVRNARWLGLSKGHPVVLEGSSIVYELPWFLQSLEDLVRPVQSCH